MSTLKRLATLLVLLAVAAAVGYGFVPRPAWVDAAGVAPAPLRVVVQEEGKTRVMDRYVISSPVPGFATRVELAVGDAVTKGQLLLELEPLRSISLDPRSRAEAQARVSGAEAALRVTEQNARAAASEAALAEAELTRVTRLHETGNAPEEQVQRAEAAARQAQALRRSREFAVEVARYELEGARAALSYSAAEEPDAGSERVGVTAPIAGQVLGLIHESEGVVAAGQPLLEVGNPGALEVEVEVLSADAVRLRPGLRVVLDRWGGEPLEGRLRVVEPVGFTKVSALGVEEQRVLVIVDIVSPPEAWARLGDRYRVDATFVLWEGESVQQVPASALFRSGEAWAVFAIEEGIARKRLVELGHRNGLAAELIDGLASGAQVITHPDDRIADGVEVRVRAE